MNSRLSPLFDWWRTRDRRQRHALKIVGVVVGLIALEETGRWLRSERLRLPDAMAVADAQFARMESEIAEIGRLRGRTPTIPLQGQALVDAIAASLRDRQLPLTATLLDAEQLRVQGAADFDEAIVWLGTVHRDYHLRLVTLTATRQASGTELDAVLGVTDR